MKKRKNPAAVALGKLSAKTVGKDAMAARGRKGGLVGGNARALALTPEQRSEIARKAGEAGGRGRPKQ